MATPRPGPAVGPCTTPSESAPGVHPVDEKLPPSRLFPAALQHIAAMYAGVVTPPLIIGQAVGLDTAGRTRLIAAGLLIAGLATLLGPLFGGFPTSAFAQNVRVVTLTRVRSRYVVAVAGAVLLVLGAFPVLGAGIIPLAAPAFYADFPAWAQTVLGSGISAGALTAVLLNLFFHHLGTRPAAALESP
ncbi:solute carrier family 23 protein [Streptomyces sp. NPDC058045]|uniref:solute carrier family 23 protein n=1 Tax=Streptomyces sp. NPDC058045 TaxID=3346311 RepID=UPI0036EF6BE4